jgi:hypothetical protein
MDAFYSNLKPYLQKILLLLTQQAGMVFLEYSKIALVYAAWQRSLSLLESDIHL